jgi:beta-N-acetylhexosaminidase
MNFRIFIASVFFPFCVFSQQFTLDNFYEYHPDLLLEVDKVFDSLNDTLRVGQLIVPAVGRLGKTDEHVIELCKKGKIGGVLLLNGTVESFTNYVNLFDSICFAEGFLPPIYSADAEPTLIKYKIKGSTAVPKTNAIKSMEKVEEVAQIISEDLKKIGITQNFAPVIDASPNEVVSNRSFGLNMDTVINFSNKFIDVTQSNGIVATAKHFPGHGYVSGDTHKKLVYIDGQMKEVANYKPVIDNNVISIMVAHIAVKNNEQFGTKDLPATCSRKIVTDLLKDSLSFRGLVITDAMNMGGVVNVPDCGLKAIQAGCDVLLMPVNEEKDVDDILSLMDEDLDFKLQVYSSVKKVIRLKICLGLIKL